MTHSDTIEHLYTPNQLADLLQVTRRTVYAWIREKRLAAVRAGNRIRIRRGAVEAFLEMK
jgi:putative molybdopterin biosynthesis protein